MVPVRKPGRPLSACPHPRDRPCGCGSVTAAIPKKQTCHCGGSSSSSVSAERDSDPSFAEPTTPPRAAFKVQKAPARPQSSRKQSFDIANLERMDMSNINIIPFDQRPSSAVPTLYPNGYAMSGTTQEYGFVPQYDNIQPQHYKFPAQSPLHISPALSVQMNSLTSCIQQNGFGDSFEAPLDINGGLGNGAKGTSCCAPPTSAVAANAETKGPSNGSSCCAPKLVGRSHSSSSATSISEPQEPGAGSCCEPKPAPTGIKDESTSNEATPINLVPQVDHQMLLENGIPFDTSLYPQYLPQGTVFTYPPTYGSFQNPLQPSAWRRSARANSYMSSAGQHQSHISSSAISSVPSATSEAKDTIHTCSCGDGCQCIGCAAHPYNDATQDYVRSAWSSMAGDQPPSELYTNGSLPGGTGNVETNGTHGPETGSSPAANTPSSSTSGNGEEQNLSANDFFFVNYPFFGCGGETQSCPCGDGCQCLGCTIHR